LPYLALCAVFLYNRKTIGSMLFGSNEHIKKLFRCVFQAFPSNCDKEPLQRNLGLQNQLKIATNLQQSSSA